MNKWAQYGITLTNYNGVTHPSEPNYLALIAGDYFGMGDDAVHVLPSNYTSIVDLLDNKGVGWKGYEENYPGNCFNGTYDSQGYYWRKHNPFQILATVADNATLCQNIVDEKQFQADVTSNNIAQYSFYVPNEINDGHNTTIDVAANWLDGFLTPLVNNSNFMDNSLVVLTFDESETYTEQNKVYTILIGGAIPQELHNTTDDTFYTHYSHLKTVELNWDLGSLGRNDENKTLSNVFSVFTDKLGYTNMNVSNPPYLNQSDNVGLFATSTSSAAAAPTSSSSSGSGSSSGSSSGSTSGAVQVVVSVFAGLASIAAVAFSL